jgi:hypothetical protein
LRDGGVRVEGQGFEHLDVAQLEGIKVGGTEYIAVEMVLVDVWRMQFYLDASI